MRCSWPRPGRARPPGCPWCCWTSLGWRAVRSSCWSRGGWPRAPRRSAWRRRSARPWGRRWGFGSASARRSAAGPGSGPRPGPRRAGRPAGGPAPPGHVRHPRRSAGRQAPGRVPRHRIGGPRLSGRDPLPRARPGKAHRGAGRGRGDAGPAGGGRLHPGVPAGAGGDPAGGRAPARGHRRPRRGPPPPPPPPPAADQRGGRAGRREPEICYRLWEEAATGALEAYARPEILSADLAPLLLDCAAWGVADPTGLAFLDPPPAPALKEARGLLRQLHALDDGGRITDTGRSLRDLPLPPRLARMVLAAGERGQARDVAAVLVERGLGGDALDLTERVERFRRDRSRRAEDMRRMAEGWAKGRSGARGEAHSIGALLTLAYPDRIARARGKTGEYLMANGRGAALEAHERLAREPYLAIAEVTGAAASARILAAAPISPDEIEALVGQDIEQRHEVSFDRGARALRARAVRRYGALVLNERPLPVPATEDAARALAAGLVSLGLDALPWSKALAQWRERVMFLRGAEGDEWPDLSDAALAQAAEEWLAPHLVGKSSLNEIGPDTLSEALRGLLPWNLQRRLDLEAPTHMEVPTGSQIPVDYGAEEGPVLAVRVQELFGMDRHPAIAAGRVPLILHLLSPAQRPIQITRDLPGFWRGSWAAVRADMRGQYPKHPWPEDPLNAEPTRRAKPRGT